MRHVVETKGKENYIRLFFLFKSAVLVDFIRDGDLEMETEKVLVCLLLRSGRAGRHGVSGVPCRAYDYAHSCRGTGFCP